MAQTGLERVKRFGLRCLMVAGFASAAWALASSAAHAAEEAAPAEKKDLSVINLVSRLGESLVGERGAVTSLVGETLGAGGTSPCQSAVDGAATPECVTDAGTATTQPAGTRATQASAGGELVQILRGLTSPLGLSEVASASAGLVSPLALVLNPLVDPLTPVLRPITSTLNRTASPVTTSLGAATKAAKSASTRAMTSTRNTRVVADPAATIAHAVGQVAASAHPTAARGSTAARPGAGAELRAGTPAATGGSGGAPERPTRRPMPVHHGAGSGFFTTGPGSVFDGGSFAVVPSSVVAGSNASGRTSVAAHVAVLRLDAEDRTFSPD